MNHSPVNLDSVGGRFEHRTGSFFQKHPGLGIGKSCPKKCPGGKLCYKK